MLKAMKKLNPTIHYEQLPYLRKIEGQIRGIQKMIEGGRYCIDILTQLHSVVGAILRTKDGILKKHIEGCVANAIKGKSELERMKKINEIVDVIQKFRLN